MKTIYFLLLIGLGVLVSCSRFDESDSLPAFLMLNDPAVSTTPEQGVGTENITDVWVALDGQTLGVFPLPASVPAIFTGETSRLEFFAGIRNNGIRDNAIIYPFYERIEMEQALQAGESVEIPLEFKYKDDISFRINADFDLNNPFTFDEDGDGDLGFDLVQDAGNTVGKIEINEQEQIVEIATDAFYQLPTTGGAIFLEMDYKGNMDLLVGTTGISQNTIYKNFIIILKPQEEWNKIYIDLSTEIATSQLEFYRIILATQLIDNSVGTGELYIDNVKLIHF